VVQKILFVRAAVRTLRECLDNNGRS